MHPRLMDPMLIYVLARFSMFLRRHVGTRMKDSRDHGDIEIYINQVRHLYRVILLPTAQDPTGPLPTPRAPSLAGPNARR